MTQTNSYRRLPLRNIAMFCLCTLPVIASSAEERDSVKTKVRLQEVRIDGHRLQTTRAAMPVQLFSENEFSRLNAGNVTDVAKHFAGVTVKDYGGIGGLKTVSLRGLGAQHTGVSYDGVILSDIQSGQIDLSRFSLDNISDVSLNNGQPNDIFQSARMFASAGVLCLNTKLPEFNGKNELHGNATVKTGSFGLFNPSLFLNRTFGKKWALNLSGEGMWANGRYRFLQNYNQNSANGISEVLTRKNSDVQSLRTELNAIYRIRSKENISFKANYYNSERGLPGAVIFYNDYSVQRLWDKSFLSQIHYENKISNKVQFQGVTKYNHTYSFFRDLNSDYNDANAPKGERDEKYYQNETYLSSSLLYRLTNSLSSTAAVDWWYNDLEKFSTNKFATFNYPTRNTGLANLATKYVTDRWSIIGNLLYTLSLEKVRTGQAAPNRNRLSPTASISYKLLANKELRVRAFYKNIFRIPTFNDLYYQDFGNTSLKPEITNQYNVGMTYSEANILGLSEMDITMDGYYNNIQDKIIATPKDLFHWSMVNRGKVNIVGCDVTLRAKKAIGKSSNLLIKGNYSFQHAEDVTPQSATFGKQIPYSPLHSGAGSVSFQYKQYDIGYNLIFVSSRLTENYPFNKLNGYQEHSVFGTTSFKKLKLTGEVINLFNKQYEVLQYYPMPRRNYRITLALTF